MKPSELTELLMRPEVQRYAKTMVQSAYDIFAVNHPRSEQDRIDQKKIIATMFAPGPEGE